MNQEKTLDLEKEMQRDFNESQSAWMEENVKSPEPPTAGEHHESVTRERKTDPAVDGAAGR